MALVPSHRLPQALLSTAQVPLGPLACSSAFTACHRQMHHRPPTSTSPPISSYYSFVISSDVPKQPLPWNRSGTPSSDGRVLIFAALLDFSLERSSGCRSSKVESYDVVDGDAVALLCSHLHYDAICTPGVCAGWLKSEGINQGHFAMISAAGSGKGGGLLEKPLVEKNIPGRESEFDLRKSRRTSPPFRVLLHNDDFNKREYVVQVLMKVIPGMTLESAVNIMQEAHHNGLAVVIICSQDVAEEHCMQLRSNGLLSSIEPASSGGC